MIFIVYSHVIPTTMTLSKWSKIKHLKNKDIKVKENKLTCAVLEMSSWLSQNCLLAFPILYDILLLAQTRIFFQILEGETKAALLKSVEAISDK